LNFSALYSAAFLDNQIVPMTRVQRDIYRPAKIKKHCR